METPVTAWDASGNPVQSPAPVTAWDEQGQPVQSPSPSLDSDQAQRATDALVYSHLTGAPPSFTYENRDALHKDFSERLGEYASAGWKGLWHDSILAEWWRGKLSGPLENDDEVSKFAEGFGQMIGDLPVYGAGFGLGTLAGGAAGSEVPVVGNIAGAAIGGGAGGFGLTAGLRKWLVDKYNGKQISAFSEVMDVLKESGKGALTGAAFGVAGEAAPVAEGVVGKILGPRAYKLAAELATMTTVSSALEGKVPSAHDFVSNAAMLAALHVGTMGVGAAKDYLGKTYVDSGVHPSEAVANPDGVPPPVEQDDSPVPKGILRPAIREGDKITPGEPGEHHDDILERMEPKEDSEKVRQGLSDFLDKATRRIAMEQRGQDILDDMADKGISPAEVSEKFWNETYFNLPEGSQDKFQRYLKAETGFEPGDVIGRDAQGRDIIAKDWGDIAKNILDIGSHPQDAENLEGTTRGLVAGMKEGNDRFGGEQHLEQKSLSSGTRKIEEKEGEEPRESTGAEAEHGFLDPQGRFLNRQEARQWVDENEPQVSKNLEEAGAGELTTEDYNEAQPRDRAPSVPSPTAEVSSLRKTLTKISDSSSKASKFGAALRTFFVGNRDARIAETNQLADSLRKSVPDYRDQEALSLMRDFKNRRADLELRRDQYQTDGTPKLKKLVPIIDRALNPTPEMLKADEQLTQYFTKHLDEGKRLGFIDSTISNDEYITHLLKPETEAEVSRGTGSSPQIGRNFRFNRERKYETILDALETGTVKAQTLNALDSLNIYGQKHATAAATRIFINELKQGELGKWGFKNGGNMPSDWVELAPGSGLFRNTVPYIDRETGEPTFAYQSLMVPPKVRDAMKPIIESANITGIPGFQAVKAIQAYVKAAELGLSVFHMKALSITALNNQGVSGLVRSMASDMESSEFKDAEVDGVRAGLQTPILGRTIEAYRSLTKETLPSRTDVITKLRSAPGIKQLDDLAAGITHFTFDVLQRKFKVMDYSIKKAAWMAKHPDATGEEITAAKSGIAKEVNAAYGGLNWEVLGASKTSRHVAQAFLLAPDWTFSNVFNAKYAFEGGPAGAAARSFWIRSTLTGMAMTQAMSILVSGQQSSHPSEVYLGKDKDGREIYSDMFFAGAPKDMITFLNNMEDFGAISGLAQSIRSKLSPLLRTGSELAANRDWMGREIAPKGKGALSNTEASAWHVATGIAPIPFSVTNTIKLLTDTEHDYGFWDYASVVTGSPPRHELPAGEKPHRKRKFSVRGAYR